VAVIVPHLFGATAFRQESVPVAAGVWLAERLMPIIYRAVPVEVISRSTAADLVERGFEPDRIRVSYPGVDHQVYRVPPARSRFPQPTIAYVGRLQRYKGLDIVLRALAVLRSRGSRIRFLIAGRGDDRKRLESIARRLEIAEQVEFLGFVSQEKKVEILQRCWCNVYPSPKEGWGISNVEAAACGTPSVASDAPGLRESVEDGVTGFLVPHDDREAWATCLDRLVRDTQLRERLGRGAVEHASRFTWEATAKETEDMLREACSFRR
jgi:glycosyltransferase involved in cell wall biosynthesis